MFPLFYDSSTWNPYPREELIKVQRDAASPAAGNNTSAMFISLPALRDLARQHFGCDALPGTPADPSSLASHFRQRLFGVRTES